jgi:hypothetical protein
MEQGNPAIFYTHNGPNNGTTDELAIVLREGGGWVDLVVFPVGGPTQYVRAAEFDADDPYLVDGGSYVRAPGDAPDFSERFKYSGHPEWAANLNRIRAEREAAPAAKREDLKKQHQEQMAAVRKKLDEENPEVQNVEEPNSEETPPPRARATPPAQPSGTGAVREPDTQGRRL